MAVASERYVHFLVDVSSRLPQRCRVSLAALAALEGACPTSTHLSRATPLFLKHRRTIEELARGKLNAAKEPVKWISISACDADVAH